MQDVVEAVMDARLADLLAGWREGMAASGRVDDPLVRFCRHADHLIVIEIDAAQFRYAAYGRAFAQGFGVDLTGQVIDLLPADILPADRRGMLEFEYRFAYRAARPLWRSYTAPFAEGRTETWQRLVLPIGGARLVACAYPLAPGASVAEDEDEASALLRLVIERVPVVLDAEGRVSDLALSLKTYTDTQQQVAELEILATVDPLTGVANRRHFHRLAELELDHARRMGRPLSVLALDLDHFKQVNDRFGHAAGDMALKTFVGACRKALRDLDIVGRVGGEEFAVVLPNVGAETAALIAERLRRQVEASPTPLDDGRSLVVTVSIGVATNTPVQRRPPISDNPSLTALLARADAALYRSKEGGRNRVHVATVRDGAPPG